jgi:hypothetical protein
VIISLGGKKSFTDFYSGKIYSPKLEKGKRVDTTLIGG